MPEQDRKTIEVRGFLQLDKFFREKLRSIPLIIDLAESITGAELAEKLEIPLDEVEVVIVNGLTQSLNDQIQPGDRVAFLPPGCPGPYRIILGFYAKNQDNRYNFTLKKSKKN